METACPAALSLKPTHRQTHTDTHRHRPSTELDLAVGKEVVHDALGCGEVLWTSGLASRHNYGRNDVCLRHALARQAGKEVAALSVE